MSEMRPQEPRSFLALGERSDRSRPRKELRKKPYTLAEVSNHIDDLADGLEDIVFFMAAIHKVGAKTWRYLKWATPMLLAALVASGVVTGPLGDFLKYIAEHLPTS